MKNTTKKIALSIMATTAILALWITNVSAMWNGQGGWQGMWKWQGNHQGQGQWNWQDHARQTGHGKNIWDMISDIPAWVLDDKEKESLINQYGEEKMARDLYAYAYEKYSVQTFGNITNAEQQHMDAIKVLLDRYNIEAPSDYAADNELYNTLKDKIDLSEKDAIEVGIMVEKVDIDNILADIKNTDNDDLKVIFTNIGWASYNHLRGFIKALNNNSYTTEISYSDYLNNDEINTKGGWLKVKLAEKLEAEGINLPEKASSSYIKENCGDKNQWNKGWKMANNKWNSDKQMAQRSKMELKKNSYKKTITKKYSKSINKIKSNKQNVNAILVKIDDLVEKTQNSSTLTEDKKISKIALLEALRELLESN